MSAEGGANSVEGKERQTSSPGVVEKTVRAATAIIVFGIPLAVGAATALGFGVRAIYRCLAGTTANKDQKR